MLTLYQVEFYTGKEDIGPFVHVVAKNANVARILGLAERIAQDNDDLRIEHVWEMQNPEALARVKPFLLEGKQRVIPDPRTLAVLDD